MREAGSSAGLALAFRFAMRELRSGLRGFYIFLGCIALGVAAIGGVNSVAQSITEGIRTESQAILGGDLSFTLVQREINQEQRGFLESQGSIAEAITMRGMARLPDGSDQTLVELKAVGDTYPAYGELVTAEGTVSGADIDAQTALVEPLLFERLGLKPGDEIEVGNAMFTIKAGIVREPDRVGENIGFGPRLMISRAGLERTGLIQPGSLLRYHYKLKLDNPSEAKVEQVTQEAKDRFPDTGWRIRSSENAAPALSRSIERFSQFLTLVGLTSLIVGGVGIANATRAFLETKREVIASLKSLGASGGFVFNLYLVQIMLVAGLGIVIGLALAVAMPYAARSALGTLLPVTEGNLFFPQALLPAIVFGVLTTLIFAIWPLSQSREIKPTELFRANTLSTLGRVPQFRYLVITTLLVIALVWFAVFTAAEPAIAIIFLGAIAVSFIILRVVALGIQWLAKRAPHSGFVPLRMAVANIHRPGSLTPSVTLSLGLGLALLVALASIDGNLRNQIANNIPEDAPDFFFVDIQNNQIDPFRKKLEEIAPDGKIISVPMLRGRVVSLKGISATDYKTNGGGEWVLQGDRGLTYAKNVPENSTLSQGEWWPEDYSGPPLVSVSAEEAGELSLAIGDEIVVNVLGRNITAQVASFREVEWETLGINFVFVFSPNTFAGAPHAHLATLTYKTQDESFDGKLLRDVAKAYPAVTAVRIRDALDTVNRLVGQLATAIRAAASVALFSSVLVLAGALAAGNRERVHDSVVLKTLGATRPTLMQTFTLEYALLGLATAIFALLAGSLAAWFVISVVMDFTFILLPGVAITTIMISLLLTIILGLAGTWHVLGVKPAPILREL